MAAGGEPPIIAIIPTINGHDRTAGIAAIKDHRTAG